MNISYTYVQSLFQDLAPTLRHTLTMASNEDLLNRFRRNCGERRRFIPTVWGVRLDAFYWDSWDWSVKGKKDFDAYLQVANLAGCYAAGRAANEWKNFVPGTMKEVMSTESQVYCADYWALMMHHLALTGRLPYSCEVEWHSGHSVNEPEYCFTSYIPIDLAHASRDAWTLLEEGGPRYQWNQDQRKNVSIPPVPIPVVRSSAPFTLTPGASARSASVTLMEATCEVTPAAVPAEKPEPDISKVPTESSSSAEERERRRREWLAKGMLLVRDHPDRSDARIAQQLGIDRSTLSRCPEYRAAAAMARGQASGLPRGFRVTSDESSGVEAYSRTQHSGNDEMA
ncbi:MAG: hypothetical protein HJJLKODD_02674 [Phycisphaerae bacterium]|nr:hypothetical protein [Phycisphaerae bacterium]